MKYMAWSMRNDDGGATSYLPVASPKCEHDLARLAERHASAMKAVLLAARAWSRAWQNLGKPEALGLADRRLVAAQERLDKIEKEVKRG